MNCNADEDNDSVAPWYLAGTQLPPEGKATITNRQHPQHGTHEMLRLQMPRVPRILGRRIPSRRKPQLKVPIRSSADVTASIAEDSDEDVTQDVQEMRDNYCRIVLVLFKPWRRLTDLKMETETWTQAAERHHFRSYQLAIMNNFQNYFDAKDSSAALRAAQANEEARNAARQRRARMANDDDSDAELEDDSLLNELLLETHNAERTQPGRYFSQVSGQDIAAFSNPTTIRRALLTPAGMALPAVASTSSTFNGLQGQALANMTVGQDVLDSWDVAAEAAKTHVELPPLPSATAFALYHTAMQVQWLTTMMSLDLSFDARTAIVETTPLANNAPPSIQHFSLEQGLNRLQHKAFALMCAELLHHHPSNQAAVPVHREGLGMILQGTAGTGKTHVIKSVVLFARHWGMRHAICICAPTGIAATIVKGGATIHSTFGISSRGAKAPNTLSDELYYSLAKYRLYIIDELSMVSQSLFYSLHKVLSMVALRSEETGNPNEFVSRPFGNHNVVMCGDFNQLPPVLARSLASQSNNRGGAAADAASVSGRQIWVSYFTKAVVLKEMMRQDGASAFADLINAVRDRHVTEEQLDLLNSKVIDPATHALPATAPDRPLVGVFRTNAKRSAYNDVVTYSRAESPEHAGFVLEAIITRSSGDTFTDEALAALLLVGDGNTEHTPLRTFCCLHDRVLINNNIGVPAGIANGTLGYIVGFVWPEGTDVEAFPIQAYEIPSLDLCGYFRVPPFLPLRVLVYCPNADFEAPEGMPDKVWPLDLVRDKDVVAKHRQTTAGSGFKMKLKVSQFPFIKAFGVTQYKAQGQTLDNMLLHTLDGSPREQFVMISRLRSLEGLHLIEPASLAALSTKLDVSIAEELVRLDVLAENT